MYPLFWQYELVVLCKVEGINIIIVCFALIWVVFLHFLCSHLPFKTSRFTCIRTYIRRSEICVLGVSQGGQHKSRELYHKFQKSLQKMCAFILMLAYTENEAPAEI